MPPVVVVLRSAASSWRGAGGRGRALRLICYNCLQQKGEGWLAATPPAARRNTEHASTFRNFRLPCDILRVKTQNMLSFLIIYLVGP